VSSDVVLMFGEVLRNSTSAPTSITREAPKWPPPCRDSLTIQRVDGQRQHLHPHLQFAAAAFSFQYERLELLELSSGWKFALHVHLLWQRGTFKLSERASVLHEAANSIALFSPLPAACACSRCEIDHFFGRCRVCGGVSNSALLHPHHIVWP
jgi:hypothetical protein